MEINGFNTAIDINSQGLFTLRHIEVQGIQTAMTGCGGGPGPLIHIGNPADCTGGISGLQNSVTFEDIGGNGASGSDNTNFAVNYAEYLMIDAGTNIHGTFRDIDGFNGGIRLGTVSLYGGSNQVIGFDICAGHMEDIAGWQYLVDSGSSGKLCLETGQAELYLGPAVVLNSQANVELDLLGAFGENSAPPNSVTALTSGGILADNTTYCLGAQAYNPAASIIGSSPAVTVAWQNFPTMSCVTTGVSGGNNSIVMIYPAVNNTASFNIVEGTTANANLSNIINTTTSGTTRTPATPTGTYTYTGHETVGAVPSIGNVPFVTVGSGASLCVNQTNSRYSIAPSTTSDNTWANKAMDNYGSYYTPGACEGEYSTTNGPTPQTTTNALYNEGMPPFSEVCPPGAISCNGHYIWDDCVTNGSGIKTCTWIDLANPLPQLPFTLVNSTVNGTVFRAESTSIDTGLVGKIRSDVFATSGQSSAYYGDTAITNGALMELFGPSSTSVYDMNAGQFNQYVPHKLLPPQAATNGTNYNSPCSILVSNFWGSAASTSSFTICNLLSSTTANNPNSVLDFAYNGGSTSVGSVNFHSLPLTTGLITQGSSTVPVVATPTVGNATCVKTAATSTTALVIGYCSTVVSSSGTCTCN